MILVGVTAEADLFYKTDELIDLKIPCINNDAPCSSIATCNITINYPNGSNYVKNQPMTNNSQYFNYTISSLSVMGEYSSTMFCYDTNISGYSLFSFMVNNAGNNEKPYALTLIFIILPLIAAILCLIWAFNIDGKNSLTMNEGGEYQLEINYGWYAKIVLFFLSILFFWITTFMAWQASDIFTLTETITNILKYSFNVETILLGVLIPTFIILSIVKHVSNVKYLKEVERGLSPR